MQRRRRPGRPPAKSEHPNSFVKIILPSAIHGNQTRIPEAFIRGFRGELSAFARISVPNGGHWEVGLKKCGKDDVWFCTNWREFAKYYSISYGFVLTFDYQGDSEFYVRIYDTSATEIRYPRNARGQGSPRKRSRVHHQDQASFGYDEYEGRSKNDKEYDITTDHVDSNVNLPRKNQRSTFLGRQGKSPACNRKHTGTALSNSNSSSKRAKEAATKLKPKNPCFKAAVRSYAVYIPAEFAAKHLKLKQCIKLQNCDGQRWDANCLFHRRASAAMRLGQGWSRFARENHVSEGDVCVFEMIKRRPVVLKVGISRADECGNSRRH